MREMVATTVFIAEVRDGLNRMIIGGQTPKDVTL